MNRRSFLRGKLMGHILDGIADRLTEATSAFAESPARSDQAGRGGVASERYCKSFPVLRPPGAIAEDEFLDGCTRCDACVKACPHGSITPAPPRFRRAAGTPMIDPMQQFGGGPCWMCEDKPCIKACESEELGGSGVLQSELPIRLGEARVDITVCLAHQGSFCTVCSEQCPVEDAIEVVNGRPRIIEDKCTGCGVCQHVCPAVGNAILLTPVADRPPRPNGKESNDG